MGDTGNSWPEQEAVCAWMEKRGVQLDGEARLELCKAVSQPRLQTQHRLAEIERRVIYRTADMPEWAVLWMKLPHSEQWPISPRRREDPESRDKKHCFMTDGLGSYCHAPDLRPDEPGPLWVPIIDAPEDAP